MPSQRVTVFIDYMNFYNGARRAFFSPSDSHTYGQIDPIKLGELICSRPAPGFTTALQQVRIYTGRPDATHQPKAYAAHMRQCSTWQKSGVVVTARTLRYPRNWPNAKPEQKGVDVALAIDFIALAIDGTYDAGIIASTDTDLIPALEFVYDRFHPQRQVEVANWTSLHSRNRLRLPRAIIWCHQLNREDYDHVADPVDYNIP